MARQTILCSRFGFWFLRQTIIGGGGIREPAHAVGDDSGLFVQEATAMADVDYAMRHRDVRPQHVHSFLELVPLATVLLVGLLHWPQVQAGRA